MQSTASLRTRTCIFSFLAVFLILPGLAQEKRPLTFEDVMKFKAIQNPVLSDDGAWVAYGLDPDRGDGRLVVQAASGRPLHTADRGGKPVFSKNSRWVAAIQNPPFSEVEKAQASGKKGEEPKQGLALLDTGGGRWKYFERVENFAFSDDSRWLALIHFQEEKAPSTEEKNSEKKGKTGSTLVLYNLASATPVEIPFVTSFAFDPGARFLAYARQKPEGKGNGLFYRQLGEKIGEETAIFESGGVECAGLEWSKTGSKLAFLSAPSASEKEESGPAALRIWDGTSKQLNEAAAESADGWILPIKNQLTWSDDGSRLFLGRRPPAEAAGEPPQEKEPDGSEVTDIPSILEKREVDVWHWNDPLIVTQQKKQWPATKDRTFLAVYDPVSDTLTPLADESMPQVAVPDNADRALGLSDVPYRKEITWDGRYSDVYIVSLQDGSRKKVVSRLAGRASLSPGGKFVAYYRDGNWYLYDAAAGTTRCLTDRLDVPFADEDHDTPDAAPGYGIAGWTEDDAAVLVYDKFDIWQFPTAVGDPLCLTAGAGRREKRTFRVLRLDPEEKFYKSGEALILSSYHDLEKNSGFYSARVGQSGIQPRLEEDKKFDFLQKAAKADVVLYTRQSYAEFPDLWIADREFRSTKKISDANPQMSGFLWGDAELVEWNSLDGVPLQGVLIKPGDYEPGKRVPVIVYYYELFSQRLYEFNQPVVNHRPCFPLYTSNGYAIFLPDVRFSIGQPGYSTTKCVVPGVQKLIDMGVADPKRIGLHGHSWSGYQTAFAVTQTNIFAAAVAGAPVSNMTSAYSGIRWESGLARQFQYEKGQSRIGGNLWENLQEYIENSPVFYADRIHTPLLIEFGDEDGAVPWYQGIELYLAMRRLGKDCIFLEYRGEPHHLRKYPNKLDYAIKMKEYFDHYLKGLPAADWIAEGVPYRGK